MWRAVFVDLLTMVGIFAAGFLLGRGTWPRRYQTMKRRWLEKRNEVKRLREQMFGEVVNRIDPGDTAPPALDGNDEEFDDSGRPTRP